MTRTLASWVLAVIVLAGFAGGQSDLVQQSAPAPSDARYSVSGTVVNSVTGEPVRRALVQVYSEGTLPVLSDGEGRFEIDRLPESLTGIGARKPGYFSMQELDPSAPPATVNVGPNSQPVVIKLVPESVVFGRVQSSEGEPLEGVQIKLIAARIVNGRKRWESQNTTVSDEDGAFRFALLQPGSYYVEAGPGWQERLPTRRGDSYAEGYPAAFQLGASEISTAAPLEVDPGQQVQADFSLKTEPLVRISGKIAGDAPGENVNLQVMDASGDALPFPFEVEGETGTFQARVLPGSYVLHAEAPGDSGQSLTGDVPVTVHGDVTGIRLSLAPAVSVRVLTRFELSNRQIAAAVRKSAPSLGIHLVASEASTSVTSDHYPDAGSEGQTVFRNLKPGQYSIAFSNSGPWYVQSAQCGGTDLLREKLTVSAGVPLPPIEVVVRDDGAAVTGTVMSDGHPAPGSVIAIPDRAPEQAILSQAGPDGRFQLSNLAPGSYSILAFDSTDRLEYANPSALSSYLASASRVVLQPQQESEASVNLTHGEN